MKQFASVKFWIVLGVMGLWSVAALSGQPQKSLTAGKARPVPPVAAPCTGSDGEAVAAISPDTYTGTVYKTAAEMFGKRPPSKGERPNAPEMAGAVALWSQPSAGVTGYVDQIFPDAGYATSYIADDFTNANPWHLSTIFVEGAAYISLANATSLTWSIYPVAGPTPPGYPGSGAAPYWTLTLPPADPQVAITPGFFGNPEDVALNLFTPLYLPPGNWWLEFVPTMAVGCCSQWFWMNSATTNGLTAQINNVGGGFWTPGWQPVTTAFPGYPQQDMAFRLDGCVANPLPVNDGGFENGPYPTSAWTEWDSTGCTPWIGNWTSIFGIPPRTGNYEYWAGGYCGSANSDYAEQSIVLPTASQLSLIFWTVFYRPSADDLSPDDDFYVSVNGTPVFTKAMVQANNTFPNWVQQTVDLTAYQGQTVTLRIGGSSVGALTGNVLVDDLSLAFCCPTITLSPVPLPTPIFGVPYSVIVTASGGTGPYTFAVTAGTLPAGLTLAPDGTLSGTMTALTPSSFTITATDTSTGCTGSQAYSVSTFSALFKDDLGRSLMCVNRLTGAFTYQILAGPGVGVYTGTCAVMNGGAKYVNPAGSPFRLNMTYDPIRKKAAGYYITAGGAYNALSDANTANNTGGCP